ncbi:MAG: FAD-dependent monooxygenase, partial [Microbacterium sp.]
EALGAEPRTLSYYNRFGQLIWSEPRGIDAGYRWPQLSVHRGRLQLALRDAVQERLGPDAVRLGHVLVDVRHGDGVDTARLRTLDGGNVEAGAEVIVGADGIHSVLRRQFHRADRGPVWNGLTLWRGTATAPAFIDGRTMIMAGDGDQKFVAYPLSAPDESGRVRVNFIAERRGAAAENADWNRTVEPAPIVDMFRDWRFDWLDVPSVIAAADAILEYPMVDLDPVDRWTFGRSTLLGDAAHAMYPNGSNGASQAIIDARTLAFHLATSGDAPAALAAYEADRRPATAALAQRTRETGPERVMQLAAERAPEGFADIAEVIPQVELAEIAAGYKRAAGFHPDHLNARASLSVPVPS